MQALYKLGESKAVVKVRKEDLALIKEVVEPARSKFNEARLSLACLPDLLRHWEHDFHLVDMVCMVLFRTVWPEIASVCNQASGLIRATHL